MTPEERNATAPTPGEEYELQAQDVRLYDLDAPRDAKLVAWRLECFKGAGMDELTASSLAVRRDVDRVVVERLLKAGASPRQVVELLT